MATQTHEFASFASGAVRVEFDVNDANWRIGKVRCVNNTAYPAAGTVLQAGVERFNETAPANATTEWNVPGMQIGWDSVDGGIMLGAWELRARWPA